MPIQLENIYLSNVALYFQTEFYIIKLIKIKKKCHLSVCSLKINPYFVDENSTNWFFEHFSPDTINRKTKTVKISKTDLNATLIRNPVYFIDKLKNPSNIIYLFPNITHLIFNSFFTDNNKHYFKYVFEHADKFTKLEKIEGPIDHLVKFFKSYTKDGKELYVPLPKIIKINKIDRIEFNEENVNKIEELMTYIWNKEIVNIICHFDESPKDNEHNQMLMKRLSNIHHLFDSIHPDSPQVFYDNCSLNYYYYHIIDGIGNNEMNKNIQKY